MSNNEDGAVIAAMLTFGGGFIKALAAAAQRADQENFRKIKETWAEEWAKYAEMAKR